MNDEEKSEVLKKIVESAGPGVEQLLTSNFNGSPEQVESAKSHLVEAISTAVAGMPALLSYLQRNVPSPSAAILQLQGAATLIGSAAPKLKPILEVLAPVIHNTVLQNALEILSLTVGTVDFDKPLPPAVEAILKTFTGSLHMKGRDLPRVVEALRYYAENSLTENDREETHALAHRIQYPRNDGVCLFCEEDVDGDPDHQCWKKDE